MRLLVGASNSNYLELYSSYTNQCCWINFKWINYFEMVCLSLIANYCTTKVRRYNATQLNYDTCTYMYTSVTYQYFRSLSKTFSLIKALVFLRESSQINVCMYLQQNLYTMATTSGSDHRHFFPQLEIQGATCPSFQPPKT